MEYRPYVVPIITIMLVSFTRISAYRVVTYFGSTFIVDVFGFNPAFSTGILSMVLLCGSVVNIAGGWFADHLGRRFSLIISNLLATPAILWLSLTTDPGAMIFALLLFALVFFIGSASESAYLADVAPLKSQAAIFGIVFSIETGVASFTLFFFGFIAQIFGLRISIVGIAIIVGLGIIAAYFLKEQ
jgi:MFS family permease